LFGPQFQHPNRPLFFHLRQFRLLLLDFQCHQVGLGAGGRTGVGLDLIAEGIDVRGQLFFAVQIVSQRVGKIFDENVSGTSDTAHRGIPPLDTSSKMETICTGRFVPASKATPWL